MILIPGAVMDSPIKPADKSIDVVGKNASGPPA